MPPLMQEILGRNIKTLREERKLSKEALARDLNVGWRNILRWENGENIPTPTNLEKLADYFGVTVNQLVAPGLSKSGGPDRQAHTLADLEKRVHKIEKKLTELTKAVKAAQ